MIHLLNFLYISKILAYSLFFFSIIFSIFVLISTNIIYSVIFMICSFVLGSLAFFLLNFDAFGFIFIIVYVGAIAVLFLFVVMMLDIKMHSEKKLISFFNFDFLMFIPFFGLIYFLIQRILAQFNFFLNSKYQDIWGIYSDFINFKNPLNAYLSNYFTVNNTILEFKYAELNLNFKKGFLDNLNLNATILKDLWKHQGVFNFNKLCSLDWADLSAETSMGPSLLNQMISNFSFSKVETFELLMQIYHVVYAPVLLCIIFLLVFGLIGSINIAMNHNPSTFNTLKTKRQDSVQQFNKSSTILFCDFNEKNLDKNNINE